MWESLKKLRALPEDTTICSGHEYTLSNAKFALSLEEDNPALKSRIAQIKEDRSQSKPTVPSRLSDEISTNPFLRADVDSLKSAIGMAGDSAEDVIAEIRGRKDRF